MITPPSSDGWVVGFGDSGAIDRAPSTGDGPVVLIALDDREVELLLNAVTDLDEAKVGDSERERLITRLSVLRMDLDERRSR